MPAYKCSIFSCVTELKSVVPQSTLVFISWKILLKTCCLKFLIRQDTIRWWAELSDPRQFRSYLNTDPVVKLLAHYIGLFGLNRKWSCFCCFSNLFESSLNLQYIYDISHLLWICNENTKYEKIIWRQHGRRLISFSKGPGIMIIHC